MAKRQVEYLINRWKSQSEPLAVKECLTRIWRQGSGPPVLCLHGVPASAWLYRKVLSELSALGLQGIAIDLPGMGLADRPVHFDYSWSGLSAWLASAVDHAELGEFHLVVHDIAGPIGFDLIRRIPDRIASLSVLNTMVDVSTFHRPWMMAPFANPLLGRPWLWGTQMGMFLPLMRHTGVLTAVPSDELGVYSALLRGTDRGAAFLKIMRGFELNLAFEARIKAALSARSFPAQVIWGREDPALRESIFAPRVASALGLSEWHSVPGKHFLQEDSAPLIAAAIAKQALERPPGQ